MKNRKKHSAIRTFLGVSTCRFISRILRILRRGGTTLPGRAGMLFDKALLETVSRGMEVIVITGTNGKTTTSGILRQALLDAGITPLSNRSGANLITGITTEFATNATLTGKPQHHYAVIECDEGALKGVVPLLHPRVILVTNLFRDQLDRYGEVTFTLNAIKSGILLAPEATLCLNADCSLTASLARDVPNPVYYYGINVPGGDPPAELSDAKYCIQCGTEYTYSYHTFAHLGGYTCPKCGYSRPKPQLSVTEIAGMTMDGSRVKLHYEATDRRREEDREVTMRLPAFYNIYNGLAAAAAFAAAGYNRKYILKTLTTANSSFGRMESFTLDNVKMQMILIKNPAGANQVLSYISSMSEDYSAVFCLNDKIADGHDVSWIWDADFEKVAGNPHCKNIFVSGIRAEDMQLRLKYAGAPEERITLCQSEDELIRRMTKAKLPVFILPNYTSMLALRRELSRRTGGQGFWEG